MCMFKMYDSRLSLNQITPLSNAEQSKARSSRRILELAMTQRLPNHWLAPRVVRIDQAILDLEVSCLDKVGSSFLKNWAVFKDNGPPSVTYTYYGDSQVTGKKKRDKCRRVRERGYFTLRHHQWLSEWRIVGSQIFCFCHSCSKFIFIL